MGFFGGHDEQSVPGPDSAEGRIQQQINENKVELESKRKNLAETRIGILKSQGAENWTPNRMGKK